MTFASEELWCGSMKSVPPDIVDELMSPSSRTNLVFKVLDSKIGSVLKRLLTAGFKRRVGMEEQETQRDNRFLKGRQMIYMIYDFFEDQRNRRRSSSSFQRLLES